MKKFLLLGFAAVTLLISGCAQKGDVSSSAQGADAQQQAEAQAQQQAQQEAEAQAQLERDRQMSADRVQGELRSIYFDFDQFIIRSDMRSAIDNNANLLSEPSVADLVIKVEGNTDEWGNDEYNYALGLKRAVAVRDALVAKGVSESKVELISYGESKPVCTQKTRDCWAQNRRVDFAILP